MTTDLVDYGRQCLLTEAEAITSAAERLDAGFAQALTYLGDCRGRIVVTGLGKSGHIARKISATFSSTGCVSFFLHPSEALHGDFGLIQEHDVVLAIAFSGETYEVNTVCRYAREMGLAVIALTGKLASTLASLAHVVLDGAIVEEACPLGLAPTSSAIVALALGDALAVALMKKRGFTAQQFARLHPGGSIGRKFMEVSEFVKEAYAVPADADFFAVLRAVSSENHGIVAVVDENGELRGAITDGDVRRALTNHRSTAFELTAEMLMTAQPKTVVSDTLATDAMQKMKAHKITALFIVLPNSLHLKGIVRLHDLMAVNIG